MTKRPPETESEALARRTREAREAIQDLKTATQAAEARYEALMRAAGAFAGDYLEALGKAMGAKVEPLIEEVRGGVLRLIMEKEAIRMIEQAFKVYVHGTETGGHRGIVLEVTEDRRHLGG